MKQLAVLAVVLSLGFTFGVSNAEAAKRFGGGRSAGMQKQMTPPQKAPTAAPAQNASSAPAKSQNAAAAPQAAQKRSWMGPIAGLAAGLGLAALASHFGFGEELASMMMIGLLVMAVMVAIGFFMRRRAAASQTPAMAGGMQYAAAGSGAAAPVRRFDTAPANSSAGSLATPSAASAVPPLSGQPADFDQESFLRSAKVLFIRLQAANDSANLADIREFTTPEMFAEVRMEIAERGELPVQTDVLNIDAELLDVVAEEERQVASVHFTALLREGGDAPAEQVSEVWHLVLPRGRKVWCLAGIEQVQ